MLDDFIVQDHRELSSEERQLLEWLITNSPADTTAYAAQLPQTKVVAHCNCGCPTLDLAVGEKTTRTAGPSTIIVDAHGYSPEGVLVNVIVHVREGEISELEVISMDATKVFGMPTPRTLKID